MALKEINIVRKHGKQFVPDLRTAVLPDIFRGRPVIRPDITPEEISTVMAICPVGAIGVEPREGNPAIQGCFIDLGRCMFCRECAFAVPEKIRFTYDHKIATNDRAGLIVHQGVDQPIAVKSGLIRKEIRSLFRHALKLRQISAAGDNSGEMELNAAGNVNFDMGRYGIEFVASPRHADGIVITGPISQNMADAVQVCYDATPQPRLIILVGSDAIGGGIFTGSQAIQRDFLQNYPIDLYVPGNPPHPLTFINGVLGLIRS